MPESLFTDGMGPLEVHWHVGPVKRVAVDACLLLRGAAAASASDQLRAMRAVTVSVSNALNRRFAAVSDSLLDTLQFENIRRFFQEDFRIRNSIEQERLRRFAGVSNHACKGSADRGDL